MPLFGKPQIPALHDEPAVVDWFLSNDDQLEDVRGIGREAPQFITRVRAEVLLELEQYGGDADSLDGRVAELTQLWETTSAWLAGNQGAPMTTRLREILLTEEIVSAKMRILGYFLSRRYGRQPG